MTLVPSDSKVVTDSSIVICIHGYSSTETNQRSDEAVFEDRIEKALDVAEQFESLTDNIILAFLGSNPDGDKTNAYRARKYAEENYRSRISEFTYTQIDSIGGNTKQELKAVCDILEDNPPSFIISVSNRDHTPRINRIWSELREEYNLEEASIFVANSLNNYSKFSTINQSSNPFILEAAHFERLIKVLDSNIWDIPEENYEELVDDLDDVFKRYTEN